MRKAPRGGHLREVAPVGGVAVNQTKAIPVVRQRRLPIARRRPLPVHPLLRHSPAPVFRGRHAGSLEALWVTRPEAVDLERIKNIKLLLDFYRIREEDAHECIGVERRWFRRLLKLGLERRMPNLDKVAHFFKLPDGHYCLVNLVLRSCPDFRAISVDLASILGRSPIMNKRFIVRLSTEEREQLEALVAKGKAAARQVDPSPHPPEGRLQRNRAGLVRRTDQSGPRCRNDHRPPGPSRLRRRRPRAGPRPPARPAPSPDARWRAGGPSDRLGVRESSRGPAPLDAPPPGRQDGRVRPYRHGLA